MQARHLALISVGVLAGFGLLLFWPATDGTGGRQYGTGGVTLVRLIPSAGGPPAHSSPVSALEAKREEVSEPQPGGEAAPDASLRPEIASPSGAAKHSEVPAPERPGEEHRSERAAAALAAAAELTRDDKQPPPIFGRGEGAFGGVASDYQRAVFAHLQRFRRYPAAARQDRLQGVARVVFLVRRNGDVLEARIAEGSGFPILDQEAVELIWRARPLPEIPPELVAPLTIALPVEFAAQS